MKLTMEDLIRKEACFNVRPLFIAWFPDGLECDWTLTHQAMMLGSPEWRRYWGWAVYYGLLPSWSMADWNLAGANLTGADLAGANLMGAYLAGIDFQNANLVRVYFTGADLAGANLMGAYLAGADFENANLAGVNLAGCYLAGTNFLNANLTGINLAGANLMGADLAGANLAGAIGTPKRRAGVRLSAVTYRRSCWSPEELLDWVVAGAVIEDLGKLPEEARACLAPFFAQTLSSR